MNIDTLYIHKESRHVAPITNQSQPKVWINGHYMPANKGVDGKWYVEIDGKRVEVDPNDLFGMNTKWEELDQSFEEQKANRQGWMKHWQELQGKASAMYTAASQTFEESSNLFENFIRQTGKKYSELTGTEKAEADSYRNPMLSAKTQKNRATYDSIFYARMAADEAYAMQDITNLQAVASKMSQMV